MLSRHRALVVVGLVVVGIAVVTYFTIATGTRSTKEAPPATTTKAPSGPIAELVRLVERGRSVDADVAYTGADASAAPFSAHLWRRSPLGRLDTESGSADTARRSAQLVTSSGPFACAQAAPAPWTCEPKPGLAITDIGVVSPALVTKLAALNVSVHDDRIAGEAVRCFTVGRPATATTTAGAPGDTAAAEVCLTSDGIPVRVDAGPAHLEVTSLNRGRSPDSVFKLPDRP